MFLLPGNMCYQRAIVCECAGWNVRSQEFASDTVWPRQGDRFVRFTDGLLEVIDKSGAEFGLEGIKAVLWSSEHDTLRALAERILQAARAFGYYDESLLVARC